MQTFIDVRLLTIKITRVLFLTCLFFTFSIILNGQCDCSEYIYLNEPTTNGAVHKYKIEADGTLTEIGSPWFDNDVANEGVVNPHGVTTDLNGFVYVGSDTNISDVRRFNCNGEIVPTSEFAINTPGQFNMGTIGNDLFINNVRLDRTVHISQYDLCTGDLVATVEFCEDIPTVADWGFYIDPRTNEFYATSAYNNNPSLLYNFSISDFDNDASTCINAALDLNPYLVNGNDARVYGVTTDTDGNVYIAIQEDGTYGAYVLKFGPAPTFNYIGASAPDPNEDGAGYYKMAGIVYSETTNLIYTSSESLIEDCIATFDTDLNYLGAGVPPTPGDEDRPKGIGIVTECCPNPSVQVVDEVYCGPSLLDPEGVFLTDLFPCSSSVCEAQWALEPGSTGVTYEPCSQKVTFDERACATFVKESDGTAANTQCGPFSLTFNVSLVPQPTVLIMGGQTICSGGDATALTVTTDADNIQWQMSTVSCDGPWVDIVGATSSSYTPSDLSETTYFQAVVSNNPDCGTGDCSVISDCITVTVELLPCLPISIRKN